MVDFKRSDIRTIEDAMSFPKGFGYVLDFSDRTMGEFFDDEFGINIYDSRYLVNGTSKRNCLTTFLKLADDDIALKVLRSLWDIREGLLSSSINQHSASEASAVSEKFRKVIESIVVEIDLESVRSDGIDAYTNDRTLEELVADIERTLRANKPEVALDRLHTYCVKKITHLLKIRGIDCLQDEPLHSRFGKYRKQLVAEQNLHQLTDNALKSAISLLDQFNDLRNNHSLAHDNELLGPVEARYIFSCVSALLVLLRALESFRYKEKK